MNSDPTIGTLTFSQIQALPDDEKEAYLAGVLQSESERIIQSAPEQYQLKLRHIQSQCDGIRRRVKSPLVAARMMFDRMQGKFDELRRAL